MRINIVPFEDISNVDLRETTKESPLKDFEVPKGMFQKEDDRLFNLDNWDRQHWEGVLANRLLSVDRNFGYAMHYYYRGIPDDEWHISPGKQGQSVEYYPHFEEKHYSNFFNYIYFVDVFFLQSSTVYETIGHLLFKLYDFEINEDDPRDQISFNNAIFKLKEVNRPLYRDLIKVKHSDDYKLGIRMRNDIAHNHPPYQIDSGISKSRGLVAFGIGKYTTTTEIKAIMIGLLRSIKATIEVLEKNLPVK